MNLLTTYNISKSFGTHDLFADVSFQINEGEKIALIGVNGCGKTTLFRMLIGQTPPDAGQIQKNKLLRLGYMEQHIASSDERNAYQAVLDVFSHVAELEASLDAITQQLHTLSDADEAALAPLIARQHALQERFEVEGGYTYKSRAKAALMGLGFDEERMRQSVATLSGGEASKVALARMLLSQANLLLLDEPTNHLDMPSVAWLEDFLRAYSGACLIISHDRYFLDRLVSRVVELEHGKLASYAGNYSVFREKKEKSRTAMQKHYDHTQKEIARIEGIVAQQRRWNRERNIRTAESKLKQIARLEQTLEKPEDNPETIRITFGAQEPTAQDILTARDLSKAFGPRQLFSGSSLQLQKNDRVFLLGGNGCGKTTLLKILLGKVAPDDGYVDLGPDVICGYYEQSHAQADSEKTILDEMGDTLPSLTQTQLRNALAAFLFRGDDVFKSMGRLSGGERARVALLKLMLSRANFLLLDEPTNHLDIASREALETALLDYTGTLLIVSHDRYFINKLAQRILVLGKNGLTQSLGNFDDYQAHLLREQTCEPATQNAAPATNQNAANPKANDYQLNKARKSELRKLRTQNERLEIRIAQRETEITGLEARLCDTQTAADYQKALTLGEALTAAREENETLLQEWMNVQEALSSLESGDA